MNLVLASLPAAEYDCLAPHFVTRELRVGQVLAEPGDPLPSVWFPDSGAISLIGVTPNADSVECALLGADGIFGISSVVPNLASPWRASVLFPGLARMLDASTFRRYLRHSPCLLEEVIRSSTMLAAWPPKPVQ